MWFVVWFGYGLDMVWIWVVLWFGYGLQYGLDMVLIWSVVWLGPYAHGYSNPGRPSVCSVQLRFHHCAVDPSQAVHTGAIISHGHHWSFGISEATLAYAQPSPSSCGREYSRLPLPGSGLQPLSKSHGWISW